MFRCASIQPTRAFDSHAVGRVCRRSSTEKDALKQVTSESAALLVKALSEVASGGFTKPQRWAEALKSAASVAEGVHALHGKGGIAQCLGAEGVTTVRSAVRHGLSTEGIVSKCSTQLQRLKKVIESSGSEGKAGKAAGGSAAPKRKRAPDTATGKAAK